MSKWESKYIEKYDGIVTWRVGEDAKPEDAQFVKDRLNMQTPKFTRAQTLDALQTLIEEVSVEKFSHNERNSETYAVAEWIERELKQLAMKLR